MKKFGLTVSLLALFAAPAMAQQANPAQVTQFLDIISQNGCSMTEAEAEQIFPQNGFDRDQTRLIATQLISAGTVVFANGKLEIADGSCAATNPLASNGLTAQQTQFIEILALNNCGMTQDLAQSMFPDNGMSFSIADEMADQLMDMGVASIDADGETLVVGQEYCTPNANTGSVENSSNSLHQLSAEQTTFVEIAASFGCQMTEDQMETVLPDYGMSARTADQMADELMDLGIAVVADDRMSLKIGSDYCTATPNMTVESEPVMSGANADAMYLVGTRVQRFIEIMAENGCSLHRDSIESVFNEPNLMPDDMDEIAETLMELDLAEYSRETQSLTLHSSICSPIDDQMTEAQVSTPDVVVENDGSPEGIFLSVMLENGCVLTEQNARVMFPAAGIEMADVYSIAEGYVGQGNGYYSEDDTTLTITVAACAASPVVTPEIQIEQQSQEETLADAIAAVEEATDAVQQGDPEAQFLEMMAQNACEITQANAREVTDAAGMDFNIAMGVAAGMLNDGRATSPDGGQTLQIAAPLCSAATGMTASDPKEIFIEVLRGNSCSMTATEFGVLLPVDGLDQNTAFGLITELEAEGVITLPPTRDVVTLTAENCR